jgi:hypothetical protein
LVGRVKKEKGCKRVTEDKLDRTACGWCERSDVRVGDVADVAGVKLGNTESRLRVCWRKVSL